MKKSKASKTMAEVSQGYEAFISDKQILTNGNKFNTVLKKSVKKPKPRGLK